MLWERLAVSRETSECGLFRVKSVRAWIADSMSCLRRGGGRIILMRNLLKYRKRRTSMPDLAGTKTHETSPKDSPPSEAYLTTPPR